MRKETLNEIEQFLSGERATWRGATAGRASQSAPAAALANGALAHALAMALAPRCYGTRTQSQLVARARFLTCPKNAPKWMVAESEQGTSKAKG